MKREPVTSSQIKSVGYDPATKTLELEFQQGGSVYQYSQFAPEDFKALMAAESIGSYFIREIKKRPDKFPYRKIETAKPQKTA